LGVRIVADLARLDEAFLEERFGKWGLALAGKSHGLDAGGWYDESIGEDSGPKSISHEHTFSQDIADAPVLDATLARLSEMVARRLREHGLQARTLQLKLRYSDFSTITRAHSLPGATQVDTEILEIVRSLFLREWKPGIRVRLLGVHASGFAAEQRQLELLGDERHQKMRQAQTAADRLRDKYGESAVSLGSAMRGGFRERPHENPAALPGTKPKA
jgi:DNA polymerase-4